jgi:phenylalanyl-tRNA synthetase alpha chain
MINFTSMSSINQKLSQLQIDSISFIQQASSLPRLEEIKTQVLGKTGALTDVLKGLKDLPNDQKPIIGQLANTVKTEISAALDLKRTQLEDAELTAKLSQTSIDITLPGIAVTIGKTHPITQTIDHIVSLCKQLGFSVASGPDIETEHANFEALNIPKNHPARDMHDTFYMKNGDVLRTHTSPAQIHAMMAQKPPIKIIVPGKVYRCDADITHSPMFHQIEGLYVDKNVTFAHLKGTLEWLLKELFGKNQKVRFRPSYFPFTEPSTEVDVACFKCNGDGCNLCKKTGWLEILGAGMVNKNVFRHVDYDAEQVTGFAFGLGVDRIAMLKFGISDIRLLYENDSRFLKQF